METVAATPLIRQAALPLTGFYRLFGAQLRAERKSPKTIKNYKEALGKFAAWFETRYGCQPRMGDLTVVEARLFLAHALEQPKWQGHPLLEGVTKETLSVATVHQYTRCLKTFGAWLEREDYLPAHPLQTLRLPKLDEKQLRPLSEEEERRLLGSTTTTTRPNAASRRSSCSCSTRAYAWRSSSPSRSRTLTSRTASSWSWAKAARSVRSPLGSRRSGCFAST